MSPAVRGDAWQRRQDVKTTVGLNGIDFVETEPPAVGAPSVVRLHLIDPKDLVLIDALAKRPDAFRLTTLGRDTPPRVVTAGKVPNGAPHEGDHLRLEMDRPGGFGRHTLHVHRERLDPDGTEAPGPRPSAIDPVFASVAIDFKAACPARFDCARPPTEPPPPPPPVIDYETRDYAGFRSLMLDRLRVLMPDWEGQSEADIMVTLVEQLAWAADRLSYAQDVVGTEAYLGTARMRTSVQRHTRLVDHALHQGSSAQTVVEMQVQQTVALAAGTPFYSTIPSDPTRIPHGHVVAPHQRGDAMRRADVTYESMEEALLHPRRNLLRIHPWGLESCVLPAGATRADLRGDLRRVLRPGDLLLLEEVLDPGTGLEADADPAHRFLVRLSAVEPGIVDPIGDDGAPLDVTRVHWDRADAPTCDLPVTGFDGLGLRYDDATVARGNLVLADHGASINAGWAPEAGGILAKGLDTGGVEPPRDGELRSLEEVQVPAAPPHPSQRRAHRFRLREGPLTHRRPAPTTGPAADILRGTGATRPEVRALLCRDLSDQESLVDETWEPGDLLDADGQDRLMAVEDEEDATYLRFGDGRLGRAPPDGSTLHMWYRVGNGPAGHIGRDALRHVGERVEGHLRNAVQKVRNPLPSWGGEPPEDMQAARRDATEAFRAVMRRAVTEEDYAAVARRHPEVQGAVARFRWTGSWHTVFLYVDPLGRPDLDEALAARLRAWSLRFTQTGYDVEVRGPHHVPIDLHVEVCARPDHIAADVEQAVRAALGTGVLPDGRRAFFHPDDHTFGERLHLSRIVAAVHAVEGVESVRIAALRRSNGGPGPTGGALDLGPLEVVRLGDDPARDDNGRLDVAVSGGAV